MGLIVASAFSRSNYGSSYVLAEALRRKAPKSPDKPFTQLPQIPKENDRIVFQIEFDLGPGARYINWRLADPIGITSLIEDVWPCIGKVRYNEFGFSNAFKKPIGNALVALNLIDSFGVQTTFFGGSFDRIVHVFIRKFLSSHRHSDEDIPWQHRVFFQQSGFNTFTGRLGWRAFQNADGSIDHIDDQICRIVRTIRLKHQSKRIHVSSDEAADDWRRGNGDGLITACLHDFAFRRGEVFI